MRRSYTFRQMATLHAAGEAERFAVPATRNLGAGHAQRSYSHTYSPSFSFEMRQIASLVSGLCLDVFQRMGGANALLNSYSDRTAHVLRRSHFSQPYTVAEVHDYA